MNEFFTPEEYRLIEWVMFAACSIAICLELLRKCHKYSEGESIDF